MRIECDRRKFSSKILRKAEYCLFRARIIKLKHHRYEHEKEIFKIEVGISHRLVSSDRVNWSLLSHEEYSSQFF